MTFPIKSSSRGLLCLFVGLALVLGSSATATPIAGAPVAEDPPSTDESGGEAASHSSSPLPGELGLWTLVVFLVVLAILGKFAWGPLVTALDSREQTIRDSLAEAEKAREEARAMIAQHEEKMAETQAEVRAIIEEARRDADHTKQEILQKAQDESQAMRERTLRDIDQARDHALKEIFDQAAVLATGAASRIVQRDLNPDDHRDLVQQAMNELTSKN